MKKFRMVKEANRFIYQLKTIDNWDTIYATGSTQADLLNFTRKNKTAAFAYMKILVEANIEKITTYTSDGKEIDTSIDDLEFRVIYNHNIQEYLIQYTNNSIENEWNNVIEGEEHVKKLWKAKRTNKRLAEKFLGLLQEFGKLT